MSELMQACNMDERTNEEIMHSKTPRELWSSLRQYLPNYGCNDFIVGLDHGSTVAEFNALLQRNKELEAALISIEEYWNRDNNHNAMEDSCLHAVDTAQQALKGAK